MNVPKHIGFIMDGNGRWAKERNKTRTFGHRRGFENLIDILKVCQEIGVEYVTCYAFSTENWNRPKKEIDYLMKVPVEIYKKYSKKFTEKKIKINFIGRRDRIPKATLKAIETTEKDTENGSSMVVNIAFDYGSYNEITTCMKRIAKLVLNDKITIDEIDEKIIGENLFTFGSPNVDLLIRTSGEERISNFLLWQIAYSEFYFPAVYWPDFKKDQLLNAIDIYNSRNRRYGAVKEG